LTPSNFQIKEIIVMGKKYCPECKEVSITRAFTNYLQIDYRGLMVKRQKIGHLEEDSGCGCECITL
jgi:hypothetical protein